MSDASEQREREAAKLTRHEGLRGLEMLAARYRDHAYALHTHPTWVFGVVVAGVEKLRIGRRRHLAPAGSIIIVNPEDPHDGEKGAPAGWAYRTCYPNAALMAEIAEEFEQPGLPMFGEGIVHAPELARAFVRAHRLVGQALSRKRRCWWFSANSCNASATARSAPALATAVRRSGVSAFTAS
ncbi:AraC family ligand binding domain-containing protein [Mesorhizobium sp. ORS 3428]|uniref:AraC family ligand binding domain-containing protein n=1 Tax=Mesorhizobium sp. ORS 3428 TaxID=540997 RepID=UPI0010420798|nr:AraC family ligand binding domain-containing protein [Mesorhizobium sp. ORS 3428]